VFTVAFEVFKQQQGNVLFQNLSDTGFRSLLTLPSSVVTANSPRLLLMSQLGAFTALCMLHGIVPEPLDPLVILTIIYNFDIRCLTREVVGEWNPVLKDVLEEWKHVRAGDDLQRFQSQLATLFEREVSYKV
jgi:hypothetical protein